MTKKTILFLPLILLVVVLVLVSACSAKPSAPPVPKGESSATKGVLNAPITLLIYSDFQCPACGTADPLIEEILKKYPDKLYVVYRYYPLESHRHGVSSAIAAECAKRQNKFWLYHDILFKNQKEWAKNDMAIDITEPGNVFSVYARMLNLDIAQFNQCIKSPEARTAVMECRKEGDMFQIASTPTFFLNNERVVGINSLKARYREIIERELRKRS